MSDSESEEGERPKDRAMEEMKVAVEGLQAAHSEADNAAEAGAAEQKYVSAFVARVAKALVDGMNQPVGFFAGAVADETEYYTKSDLKQEIANEVEKLRDGGKVELDIFVEERLEKVVVVKTTDHKQGAEYIWDFGSFKVETESGKDGRGHFNFSQFRDFIHESGGVNTARPQKNRRGGEEWRDFIVGMIEDRGEEQFTRGPRTQAFESLTNKIKRLTGYGTPEGAVDYTGIWVIRKSVDIPEWWSFASEGELSEERDLQPSLVKEIRVHESVIKPIIDDAEITRSALYHELNARNHTIPTRTGASINVWVNGSEERFWTLLPDVGTSRTYVADPHASGATQTGSLFEKGETQSETAVANGGESADHSSGGFDSVGDTV